MIGNIGVGGFVLIFSIALLFFGPSKLPQLGRAIGSTLSEFRKGTKELIEDDKTTTIIGKDS
ncbi:MAG: twin-arginine translocase TatA/TatE family subunit [Paenibacillaceae bacterium]